MMPAAVFFFKFKIMGFLTQIIFVLASVTMAPLKSVRHACHFTCFILLVCEYSIVSFELEGFGPPDITEVLVLSVRTNYSFSPSNICSMVDKTKCVWSCRRVQNASLCQALSFSIGKLFCKCCTLRNPQTMTECKLLLGC